MNPRARQLPGTLGANGTLDALAREITTWPRLPAPRRVARGRGRQPAGTLPRRSVLGAAGTRLGRPRRRASRWWGWLRRRTAATGLGGFSPADRSGDFLFAALHRAGLANQPTSTGVGDGLDLRDVYVTAAVRCAPPDNAPTPGERDRCAPFLQRELALLVDARVVVALGAFGWAAALRAVEATHGRLARPLPRFGHAAEATVGPYTLVGTFHPSQQNTFTGRLTAAMLDAVLARAVQLATAGFG